VQAAADLLQATCKAWAEACRLGSWADVRQQPEVQEHLAACAQLYCAAATVRCVVGDIPAKTSTLFTRPLCG
jgi:hypothetical protein